jgi:hypothetical protein
VCKDIERSVCPIRWECDSRKEAGQKEGDKKSLGKYESRGLHQRRKRLPSQVNKLLLGRNYSLNFDRYFKEPQISNFEGL